MRIFFLIALLSMTLQATAQNKVIGNIVAADNEDIIYQVKIEYVNSTKVTTGSFYESRFEMPLDSIGEVVLSVSSDGYETYRLQKTLLPASNDLGRIFLYKTSIQLQEVVIKAPKSEIKHDGTNYTIRNIQGTHIGDAGNLVDMLRWTPGIIVTNHSNISVAGAGSPLIYVNDRRVTNQSELEALSSTDVNKIEIIKEPDARYKNGTNAVVKIYLKKQLKDYLGATVSNVFTLRRRYAENPRITLSGKSGIVSGNFSLNCQHSKSLSYDEYLTTIQHAENDIFKNSSIGGYGRTLNNYTLFGGLNFALSPKATLGVQYSGTYSNVSGYNFHDITLDNNGKITSKKKDLDQYTKRRLHSASANYTWTRNEHSVLTLIADYAFRKNNENNDIRELNLNTGKLYPTYTDATTDYKIYTFNGDYSFRLGKKDRESIGAEAGYTKNNSKAAINEMPQNMNRKNQWLAAYTTFTRTWGKFSLSLGLRYEYDYTDTKALENGEITDVRKTYSNLFPNARITYKPKEDISYSFSYRRSIGRPSFKDLTPIVNYEDSLHYWTGNPLLKPAFRNTLALTANLKDLTLQASYNYITNPTISVYAHDIEKSNVLVNKPQNISHAQEWDFGLEYSTSSGQFNISAYGYLTCSYITYPYLEKQTFFRDVYTNIGGYVSYRFFKHFEAFANTYYNSPNRNGTHKYGYSLNTNVGVSGRFCKNKLYISLEGEDLFARSVTPSWTNNYADTEYWRRNRYDTRGVSLTVRYTFNTVKTNFKSKSGNQKVLQRAN